MWIAPKDVYDQFVAGEPIPEIARKHDSEPEFIESLLRAIAVGIDMGRPKCHCDSAEG